MQTRHYADEAVERIKQCRIIPIISIEVASDAIPLCEALKAGGLQAAEFTYRTEAGREAIKLAAKEFPDFLVGAGTITQTHELESAIDGGARFAVAPGFNRSIVTHAEVKRFPFFPGICTPSDIEAALESGCQVLKFFPAEAYGGLKTLKAIYAPYKHRGVRFIPTGGVDASNAAQYLAHPGVIAVGGSWVAASDLIKGKRWDQIEARTREALRALRDSAA